MADPGTVSRGPQSRQARQAVVSSQPQPPRIVRPPGLTRASRPALIPTPEHRHLPGWVRRAHAQARPILSDLLGQIHGDARTSLDKEIAELTAAISAGKFSMAWQYPKLITDAAAVYETQRRDNAEIARQRRTLDTQRRRISDQLREAAGRIPADVVSRLDRGLRAADDAEALAAVQAEVRQVAAAARTVEERRRDREIDRTRAKILKAAPRSAPLSGPTESWQDVLRRFSMTQNGEGEGD